MDRAIVTGGSGFIGSWLIQELLKNEVSVAIIVRNKENLLPSIKDSSKVTIIEKGIEEISEDDFEQPLSYDVFFHLGWGGVAPEQKNDIDIQLNNITMSLHALEVANKIGCKKFIASGTVAEYVFCDDVMDVNAKQTPNDMYGAAKVSAHYFLEVRARQLRQPFTWMVIPSTFGERRHDNNIITYTINTLLNGEKPKYGNLTQMWDFLYVGEVARAIYLIGENGKSEMVYGIGSGEYRPLREYIEMIRDLINPKLELGIGEVPSLSAQTFSSCVNIDDLVRDTGFIPKISFKEGIIKTIQYLKEKQLMVEENETKVNHSNSNVQ